MPAVAKTFAFATTAEGFVAGQQQAGTTLSYDAAVGNPAGALKARRTGRNRSQAQSYWEWAGTWEQLGVPAGTEVTGLQMTGCSTRCSEYVTGASSIIGPYELYDDGGTLIGTLWAGRTVTASSTSWTATGAQAAVTFTAQPSTTPVRIRLADSLATGNSTSAAITTYDDQVALSVTYQVPVKTGSGSGSWDFTGTATGAMVPKASGGGTWTFVGDATGIAPVSSEPPGSGAGSGSWAFAGTAAGVRTPKGSATGTTAYSGTATGRRTPKGTGSGSLIVTGTATGATTRRGTGTGVVTWTGAAVGKRSPKATASGATVWVGAATSGSVRAGAGTGLWGFTGTAAGSAPTVLPRTGTGAGTTAWTGTAAGTTTRAGAAAGTLTWTGTATTSTGEEPVTVVYDLTVGTPVTSNVVAGRP